MAVWEQHTREHRVFLFISLPFFSSSSSKSQCSSRICFGNVMFFRQRKNEYGMITQKKKHNNNNNNRKTTFENSRTLMLWDRKLCHHLSIDLCITYWGHKVYDKILLILFIIQHAWNSFDLHLYLNFYDSEIVLWLFMTKSNHFCFFFVVVVEKLIKY